MPNLVQSNGGGAVGAYTGGANPWAEAARGVDTGAYLKFNGNDGIWSFGQDDTELPCVYSGLGAPKAEDQDPGSRVITDMTSLALGFICWVDSEVKEEILVPVIEGKPPLEHTLEDHGPYNEDGDGWREAASLTMILESFGADDQDEAVGTQLLWKTSTGGQVRQIKKLSGAYGRAFAQHPGEYPVIELGAEGYAPKNKKHGKVKYSPTLKIVGWMTAAEVEGLSGGIADDDDDFEEPVQQRRVAREEPVEEAPAPRGRRQAAPVEDDEQDEPAPAPRGRRQAAPVEADEADEDVAPAPRGRRQAAAPVEQDEDEDVAPAPRGRRRPAPVEADEPEDEPAPAPRGRRQAAAPADDADEDEVPAPRGRGAGRGAPPANARLRRFD